MGGCASTTAQTPADTTLGEPHPTPPSQAAAPDTTGDVEVITLSSAGSNDQPSSGTTNANPTPAGKPSGLKVAPYRRVGAVEELYTLGDFIASGGYSDVYKVTSLATGATKAMKMMLKSKLTGKRRTHVMREMEILRRCDHPNILAMDEVVDTPTHMCLVMEFVAGGDLYDYIVTHQRYLTELQAMKITKCILLAVEYLHTASPPVVHRDIKPENVLIEDVDSERVRLSDFGLSKILVDPSSVECTPGGTSLYLPPEIIEGIKVHGGKPRPTNVHDMKSLDLWSTGIVLYILLCGAPPFRGTIQSPAERQKLLERIKKGVPFPEHKWAGVSDEARDLVECMLQLNPERRMSARQALSHKWLQQSGASADHKLQTHDVMVAEYKDKQAFHDEVAGVCKGPEVAPVAEAPPDAPKVALSLKKPGESGLLGKRQGKGPTNNKIGAESEPTRLLEMDTPDAPPATRPDTVETEA